ncbi:signal peptidase I [Desulfosporosinus fructosivorans]|uniref:Signal peptidase I n=1 Tax=Desulfosporosinus fructosivorans TaxID=2018669 RepID=A0A4Z0QYA7_9FIRM|nr:signal peptidase I [Desulfosporosinus fructosivorans]TGE35762.1 signal peptidase I [Desulfosporosinus fructosivorans]
MTQTKYTTQEQIEAMRQEIQREKEKMAGISSGKGPSGGRLPQGKQAVKTVGGAIFLALCLLIVWSIISIQMTKSRGEIPNVLGFQLFAIESGSMEPTLKIGAVIVSRKPKNPETLKVNDIVTFRTLSNAIVTHRIIEVDVNDEGSKAYRTKGDNPRNSADQELLTSNRVIGVFVAKIPLT